MHERFPNADLFGIDISRVAVARCREELPASIRVRVQQIEEVEGFYDYIYCSNVLEHFSDYRNKAVHLKRHCGTLCIMVPLQEYERGRPLYPSLQRHHQATFDLHTFDFLVERGLAKEINAYTFSCPPAWGWRRRRKVLEAIKNPLRLALKGYWLREPRQVLYVIDGKDRGEEHPGYRAL